MPLLTLSLPAAPLAADPQLAARLVRQVTDLTASLLHKKRDLTAVMVLPIASGGWFIGGEPSQATFALTIKVTAATNTKDEKAAYIAAVMEAMETALGPLHSASYVVIEEIGADSWGYGGLTQEERYITAKRP